MNRNIYSLVILLLLFTEVFAQENEMDKILNAVRLNNIELKTLQSFVKSEGLYIKSSNNLADPEIIAYYLPFGIHLPGDYSEYQISQAFEFPSVYSARSKLINQQQRQLRVQYEKAEQEILLNAKKHCLNIIYLTRKMQMEQERIQQAKSVFEMITILFNKGEVSRQELNQAKIGWLQNQFSYEKTAQYRSTVLIALQQLNGGNSITFNQHNYPEPLQLLNFDSIWSEKTLADPILKELEEEKLIARHTILLNKQMGLPDMVVGYNYQGVPGFDYSGIYGGMTIPIWNNKHRVKAAQAQYESLKLNYDEKTSLYKSEQQVKYSDFQFFLEKYTEYENTLEGLTHDLLESYRDGEITYIQYYMELHFYKEAFDRFLEVEYDLHKLRAELLAHRL